MNEGDRPAVLILGAGINGCSVARELALNGVGVWIVDANDIAFGATSKSSRLIHGGLRYLEYGDFRLVRESLAERNRLCSLAPHFVEPLRLFIPVAHRTGGLIQSASRFFGTTRSPMLRWLTGPLTPSAQRGLWTVEFGLWIYDQLASEGSAMRRSVHDVGEPGVPRVDPRRYHWLCAYGDAQMRFPERYCVALLADASQAARDRNIPFRIFTHARVEFDNGAAHVTTAAGESLACAPDLLVNATGAWGDRTLSQLGVKAPQLFGGTKGSHFVTHHAALRRAINGAGLYAEAADGRLIFVLPFGDAVLVGTTDERFSEAPEEAVASKDELAYLVSTVNLLFPDVVLSEDDVTLTYSGVRPLPNSSGASEASISRDHSVAVHVHGETPVLTLIGGKLTTSRALGELVADQVLLHLGLLRSATTGSRFVPGGQGVPADQAALSAAWQELAARHRLDVEQVRAMWTLCGNRIDEIMRSQKTRDADPDGRRSVFASALPRTFVRWVIEHEWVGRIEDLVERRLMLVYEPGLCLRTLAELADLLVESGRLDTSGRSAAVEAACARLAAVYRRRLVD